MDKRSKQRERASETGKMKRIKVVTKIVRVGPE